MGKGTSADVFRAFKNWWFANPRLQALGVNIYRDVAPSETKPPFVIFASISNVRQARTTDDEIWMSIFQLSYYDVDFDHVEPVLEVIGKEVDKIQLTLANGELLQAQRKVENYMTDDEYVAHGYLQYEATRTKDRLRQK